MKYEKHNIIRFAIVVLCSLFFAFIAERIYTNGINFYLTYSVLNNFTVLSIYRLIFLFIPTLFILIHFIVKIPEFHDKLFRYRYAVAVLLFVVLVAGRFNFSHVGMFDQFIQPGYGSEFVEPVFGVPRPIRSDEWLAGTPNRLSSQFGDAPFSRFNQILRGTETEVTRLGTNVGFTSIATPFNLFFLFGAEYGISARHIGVVILTFMMSFEFSLIIGGRNRLLAVLGACLITFSPFFQWWTYPVWIPAGLGSLVCFYYFITTDTKFKRLLFALGFVSLFSQFIVYMYPPWQVPSGYLFLGIAVWLLVEKWEAIKALGRSDWIIAIGAIALTGAVTAVYLHETSVATAALAATEYPGIVRSSGGDANFRASVVRSLFGAVYSPISNDMRFSYRGVSDFGGFHSFFPVPMLFSIYVMIKRRSLDLLSVILIAFSAIIATYSIFGWHEMLARVTMMGFGLSRRALDVALFAQLLLLIRALSRFSDSDLGVEVENLNKISKRQTLLKWGAAAAVALVMSLMALWLSRGTFIDRMHDAYIIFPFIGFLLVSYSLFDYRRSTKVFRAACVYMIIWSVATGVSVNPLMRGVDTIYSKPLSAEVTELSQNPQDRWISMHSGVVGAGFLVASGAPTINSVNIYPNLELWHRLDPEREFEHVYNRFAHVAVYLTEEDTWFELRQSDLFVLHLFYRDLEKIEVRFIHTAAPLEDFETVRFLLIYDEGGSRIYEVIIL